VYSVFILCVKFFVYTVSAAARLSLRLVLRFLEVRVWPPTNLGGFFFLSIGRSSYTNFFCLTGRGVAVHFAPK
jgi:hypothetical protein